jgi:hypothetical protein
MGEPNEVAWELGQDISPLDRGAGRAQDRERSGVAGTVEGDHAEEE